jgi:hypothetical protein
MGAFLLTVAAMCCSASAAMAYQDCKTVFPTDAQLEQRLTCLQQNTDEVKTIAERALAGQFKIGSVNNPFGGSDVCLTAQNMGIGAAPLNLADCRGVTLWTLQRQ